MLRTCLFLLLAVAGTAAIAREPASGASGGDCVEKPVQDKEPARASTARNHGPARETRVKQAARDDAPEPRLQAPRWHSFLPGMFR